MRYLHDASRILVYSAGADGRDDGGAVGTFRFGRRSAGAKDVGIEIRVR